MKRLAVKIPLRRPWYIVKNYKRQIVYGVVDWNLGAEYNKVGVGGFGSNYEKSSDSTKLRKIYKDHSYCRIVKSSWCSRRTLLHLSAFSIKINSLISPRCTYSAVSGVHCVVKCIITGKVRFYSDVECARFKALLTSVLCISNPLFILYCNRIWTLRTEWANTPF